MESSYSCTDRGSLNQSSHDSGLYISPEIVKRYHQWFETYVNTFLSHNSSDENILLKREHTLNVVKEMQYLTKSLDMPHIEALARLVALFHDIGRFRQYARFGTFADRDSVNHAHEGIRVLKQEGILAKLSSYQTRIILTAIAQHNRVHIRTRREPYRLFCKLIRDADKLDIYRLVLDYYERSEKEKRNSGIELDLPDIPEVSSHIIEKIMCREPVNYHELCTVNDFKLVQAAWIYDLNFPASLQRVFKQRYVPRLMATIGESRETRKLYSRLQGDLIELMNKKRAVL
jgi:putative nucleotidyltransferase with HDIG domain